MVDKTKFERTETYVGELERCIDCGNCTLWCPVYEVRPEEPSVARGKNTLVKALLRGDVEYSDEVIDALNTCTLCRACTEHCPVNCEVKSIVIAARADKAKTQGLARKLVSSSGYYRTGRFLAARQDLHSGDTREDRFLRLTVPHVNQPPSGIETRMTVGFFVGCTTNFLFPGLGERIIRFLTRNGVEVIVPREQGCCGSPALMRIGDFETARQRADTNARAFDGLEYVVTGCPTCASTAKKYLEFLADTPQRKESYRKYAGKVVEIVGFLVDTVGLPGLTYETSPEVKGMRVTWHDPCHLARYLGVREQPRQILRSLGDLDFVEMPRADWCCGMAGVFSENYYQLSCKIADKKVDSIKAVEADVVATSCPGCILQIDDAIKRNGMAQKVMHIVDILA
jgi:glycolate oxidase iron-sulfur subunit